MKQWINPEPEDFLLSETNNNQDGQDVEMLSDKQAKASENTPSEADRDSFVVVKKRFKDDDI